MALPAYAGPIEDNVVEQLKGQGFDEIDVSRTFLGRTRIVATGRDFRREIVLNRSNGVILRDFWIQLRNDGNDNVGIVSSQPGTQNSSSGSGSKSYSSSPDTEDAIDHPDEEDSSDQEKSSDQEDNKGESSDSSDESDSSDQSSDSGDSSDESDSGDSSDQSSD